MIFFRSKLVLFTIISLQAGDALPSVPLMEGTPADKVSLPDLFKGKKGVVFAVPGAFTPGCSKAINSAP
jgi:2-Cys peroxiredoxin 5